MPYSKSKAECHICHRILSRQADVKRHLKTHVVTGREALMHHCPEPGCKYMSLQLSNFKTHYRLHTGEKNKACPTCSFKTSDPAALTRHRKKEHGYVPPHRRAQAPRTRVSTSSSSRSMSPSELSTSSMQSSSMESVQELPLTPQSSSTKLSVLEQGNVVSAPLPATLCIAADASYLYSPGPLPHHLPQSTMSGFPDERFLFPSEVARGALTGQHARFKASPHPVDPSTRFCQPQYSSTICTPIGGYYQHLAVDNSRKQQPMFYDPTLRSYLQHLDTSPARDSSSYAFTHDSQANYIP